MIIKDISDFKENEIYKIVLKKTFTYYFKFECINNNGYLNFYWEITNNYFYEKDISSVSFSFYDGIYEKVDISDIIEYLPKNHPDIIDFRNKRIYSLLNLI